MPELGWSWRFPPYRTIREPTELARTAAGAPRRAPRAKRSR